MRSASSSGGSWGPCKTCTLLDVSCSSFLQGQGSATARLFPMLSLILSVKMMLYLATVRWSPGHTRSIPLVAPVPGATTGSWVEQWKSVAPKTGLPFERFSGSARGPLLPLPSQGGWLKTSRSTAEARRLARAVVSQLGSRRGSDSLLVELMLPGE